MTLLVSSLLTGRVQSHLRFPQAKANSTTETDLHTNRASQPLKLHCRDIGPQLGAQPLNAKYILALQRPNPLFMLEKGLHMELEPPCSPVRTAGNMQLTEARLKESSSSSASLVSIRLRRSGFMATPLVMGPPRAGSCSL